MINIDTFTVTLNSDWGNVQHSENMWSMQTPCMLKHNSAYKSLVAVENGGEMFV